MSKAGEIDPLDDILSDSQWDAPQADEPDVDFDIAMPELGKPAEDEADHKSDPPLDEAAGEDETGEASALPVHHDIESEARGDPKPGDKEKKPSSSKHRKWIVAMGMAASFAMVAGSTIYYRQKVCDYVPALATFYGAIGLPVNLLGIDFAKVELKRNYENGFPVLSVQGEVINISKTMRQVPDVRIGLRSAGGHEIYHWSINIGRTALGPDERVKFVTRLASPPEEASKIVIKFKTSRLSQMGAL